MKKLKIVIGSDHAGFEMKEEIKKRFSSDKGDLVDKGTYSLDSVDYPDFAHAVAKEIENNNADYGILLCGSANGVAITANKHPHVRAAICWMNEIASLARQHNDANVICIPARFVSIEEANTMINTFLTTSFESGRHERRKEKIDIA